MRRIMAVLAALAMVAMMAVAPASAAAKPLNGSIDLDFVGPPASCEIDRGMRTWVGTAEIGGETYGWADFSTGLWFEGTFVHFSEYWTIFEIEGDLVDDSCDPDLVLMDGTNTGWGPPGGTAKADGEVESATGPFADVEPGARMFWRGRILDEAFTEFTATLHIH